MDRTRFYKIMRYFFEPKQFSLVLKELESLSEEIKLLRNESDWCRALVKFFNLTSKWQDRGLDDIIESLQKRNWCHIHDSKIKELYSLQDLFMICGRNKFGINRTNRYEQVTEDDLYLGGIYGIHTLTITRLRSLGNNPERLWEGGQYQHLKGWSILGVVEKYQARPFVTQNGSTIIKTVELLKQA